MKKLLRMSITCFLMGFAGVAVFAQGSVTLPPSGANMKSVIKQQIGLAWVSITYSSPDVAGREGKIWGQLVPYGTSNFAAGGFGTATEGPWRAGANENTVFTASHAVWVQGKKLPAGTYGLHMIPKETGDWTLIFSHNSSQWGSYFYDEAEDALRVKVSPEEASFSEYLRYDFTHRKLDEATVVLHWENLQVPFTISVEDVANQYISHMRQELQSTAGFSYMGYNSAANYCLQQGKNLEEALQWSELAVSHPFIGNKNFTTLQTKAELLYALDRTVPAEATMLEALDMGTPMQMYQYGAAQIQQNNNDKAIKILNYAAEKNPDTWLSHAGLGASYRIQGQKKNALKHYRTAHEKAPDQWKSQLEARIKQVESEESK